MRIDFRTGNIVPDVIAPENVQECIEKTKRVVIPFFDGYHPTLLRLKWDNPKHFCKPIAKVKICR